MNCNECNNCVEKNCRDCLIYKICNVSDESFRSQSDVRYVSDPDFSVEMILR